MLEYLMRDRDQVVSQSQIMANVWARFYDGDPNVVEVYAELRRKIDAALAGAASTRSAGLAIGFAMPGHDVSIRDYRT